MEADINEIFTELTAWKKAYSDLHSEYSKKSKRIQRLERRLKRSSKKLQKTEQLKRSLEKHTEALLMHKNDVSVSRKPKLRRLLHLYNKFNLAHLRNFFGKWFHSVELMMEYEESRESYLKAVRMTISQSIVKKFGPTFAGVAEESEEKEDEDESCSEIPDEYEEVYTKVHEELIEQCADAHITLVKECATRIMVRSLSILVGYARRTGFEDLKIWTIQSIIEGKGPINTYESQGSTITSYASNENNSKSIRTTLGPSARNSVIGRKTISDQTLVSRFYSKTGENLAHKIGSSSLVQTFLTYMKEQKDSLMVEKQLRIRGILKDQYFKVLRTVWKLWLTIEQKKKEDRSRRFSKGIEAQRRGRSKNLNSEQKAALMQMYNVEETKTEFNIKDIGKLLHAGPKIPTTENRTMAVKILPRASIGVKGKEFVFERMQSVLCEPAREESKYFSRALSFAGLNMKTESEVLDTSGSSTINSSGKIENLQESNTSLNLPAANLEIKQNNLLRPPPPPAKGQDQIEKPPLQASNINSAQGSSLKPPVPPLPGTNLSSGQNNVNKPPPPPPPGNSSNSTQNNSAKPLPPPPPGSNLGSMQNNAAKPPPPPPPSVSSNQTHNITKPPPPPPPGINSGKTQNDVTKPPPPPLPGTNLSTQNSVSNPPPPPGTNQSLQSTSKPPPPPPPGINPSLQNTSKPPPPPPPGTNPSLQNTSKPPPPPPPGSNIAPQSSLNRPPPPGSFPPPMPNATPQPIIPTIKPPEDITTKKLFWDVIPKYKLKSTLWTQIIPSAKFDFTSLASVFGEKKTQNSAILTESRPAAKVQFYITDMKKANNSGIVLSRFEHKYPQLINIISHMHDRKLKSEDITKVLSIAPKEDELEKLKGYSGSGEELMYSERFLLECWAKVPLFQIRLEVIKFKLDFNTEVPELTSMIKSILTSLNAIRNSESFKNFIGLVLTIGNFLNHGTAKGNAAGFSLNTLGQLSLLKGCDKTKTPLLTFILKSLDKPALAFLSEFEPCKESVRFEITDLDSKLSEFTKGFSLMEKAKQQAEPFETEEFLKFVKYIDTFLKENSEKFEEIAKEIADVKKMFEQSLELYGEDKTVKLSEFLKKFVEFVTSCKRILEEESVRKGKAEMQRIAAEKKAARGAEVKQEVRKTVRNTIRMSVRGKLQALGQSFK